MTKTWINTLKTLTSSHSTKAVDLTDLGHAWEYADKNISMIWSIWIGSFDKRMANMVIELGAWV